MLGSREVHIQEPSRTSLILTIEPLDPSKD